MCKTLIRDCLCKDRPQCFVVKPFGIDERRTSEYESLGNSDRDLHNEQHCGRDHGTQHHAGTPSDNDRGIRDTGMDRC